MKEIESPPLPVGGEVLFAQRLVFLADARKVLLPYLQVGDIGNDRLHGYRVEPAVGKEHDVVGKVEVFCRERAAHIVALVPARLNELLYVFEADIKTAPAVNRLSDGVVHLGTPVEREDDVLHFAVKEICRIVV